MAERAQRPSPEALALGERFAPVLGFRPRGRAGERLGPGLGSSTEFEDRRAYAPGDDLRRIDWRALARSRTDEVLVRVHREEVRPRVDVLLDASRSMASEPEKAALATDLAGALLTGAAALGCEARLVVLGRRPRRMDLAAFAGAGVAFEEDLLLSDALGSAARLCDPAGLRVVVSDFLCAAGPGLRRVATARGSVSLVQVLGPWEADPAPVGAARLVDAEGAGARDLELGAGVVARYRQRLARLVDGLSDEARGLGMRFAELVAARPLEAQLRGPLLEAGIVEPAS